MRLNNLQTAAINILEKSIGTGLTEGVQDAPGIHNDLNRIRVHSQRLTAEDRMLAKHDASSDVSTVVMASLPKAITPDFKANLRTLNEFAKSGGKATDEQKHEAIKAYKALGETLKVAIY